MIILMEYLDKFVSVFEKALVRGEGAHMKLFDKKKTTRRESHDRVPLNVCGLGTEGLEGWRRRRRADIGTRIQDSRETVPLN
jgi:hypothetical protein